MNTARLTRLLVSLPVPSSSQTGLDGARALLCEYSGRFTAAAATTQGERIPEEGIGAPGTPPSSIELFGGDLTDAHWADASLVYAASRDFDDTVMLGIARSCLRLKDGARVVTLDKPLPPVSSEGEDTGAKEEFQVAWQCQVEGCWGGFAVAFVHNRVPRP